MSVVGIDIGNESCYIAVARSGGIETIANEYSQRATPTCVAFGERLIEFGLTAKNKQVTNFENTIFGVKRLIGHKCTDPFIQNELGYLPFNTCASNGKVAVQVTYLRERRLFTVQQVMAMMLTKFKEIAENNLHTKVQDCVISVPIYYTDVERRALLNAAEIAGLNPLKLLNETTAVCLAYGFYQQDLPEEKLRNVVFVDFGNSSLQITACACTKGKLKILASVWDRNLGGRDFDNVIVRHFAEEFRTKYKLDVMSNRRALIRLIQECEKLKKQMSASSLELPLNIECFMNDKDVSGWMKRETFEQLSSSLLNDCESTMKQLLQDANLKPEDIHSVEIIGGSTRLPAFKSLVQQIFGKEPSTTLNQDEAVARGCALLCAMISPKIKEFNVKDICLSWEAVKAKDNALKMARCKQMDHLFNNFLWPKPQRNNRSNRSSKIWRNEKLMSVKEIDSQPSGAVAILQHKETALKLWKEGAQEKFIDFKDVESEPHCSSQNTEADKVASEKPGNSNQRIPLFFSPMPENIEAKVKKFFGQNFEPGDMVEKFFQEFPNIESLPEVMTIVKKMANRE